MGYSQTVGYRAGTSQVFKPPCANRMLELPLQIMDTALFYPNRMDLSQNDAWETLKPILDNTTRYGGILTINWHDRSVAPERLWGDFYVRLLNCLESKRPWFSTAADAVSWFQRRRLATFELVEWTSNSLHIMVSMPPEERLPALRLRIHPPRDIPRFEGFRPSSKHPFLDVCLARTGEMTVAL